MDNSGELVAKVQEKESIGLPPVFHMEISGLYYDYAGENYQQAIAVKCATKPAW